MHRIILVKKTDRLYRNLKDWVTLDELDLEIHLVKENIILSSDSRSSEKFMHGIKVLMAKNFIDNLSEEVKKGMLEKAVDELQWQEYSQRLKRRQQVQEDDTFSDSMTVAKIDILFRNQKVAEHELHTGRSVIGRTADNDIQIRSKFVSRHHAQITIDVQQTLLEDLNSTNGVFINARRIKRHRLNDGDRIQLGEHALVYHDMREQKQQQIDADQDAAEEAAVTESEEQYGEG